jgi:hypothetical protein
MKTKLSATLITNSPQEAASENLLISAISEKLISSVTKILTSRV